MVSIACDQCGKKVEKTVGAVNRARAIDAHLYCSKMCVGLARRQWKSIEQKKAEKAEYDRWYRAINYRKLKKQKAAHYARTADREKEREIRQRRMPQHVEYCRRPEYKAKKKSYDRKRRAAEYGEFADAYLLALDVDREVKVRMTRYEIYQENGRLNRSAQKRKRAATTGGSIALC